MEELNKTSTATCPMCKMTIFDAKHLMGTQRDAEALGMRSLSMRSEPRERTQLEILMHLGEEFTPFELRYIVCVCVVCVSARALACGNVFGVKREEG